jgi:hypothetical protein
VARQIALSGELVRLQNAGDRAGIAALMAKAEDRAVTEAIGDAWRAILLRQPTWRSEAEIRAEYEAGGRPAGLVASLGEPEPGRVAIDLAEVDARPANAASTDGLLALEMRDGGVASLSAALASIPAYWLIGRRYRRR